MRYLLIAIAIMWGGAAYAAEGDDPVNADQVVVTQDAPACALFGRLQSIYVDIAHNHPASRLSNYPKMPRWTIRQKCSNSTHNTMPTAVC